MYTVKDLDKLLQACTVFRNVQMRTFLVEHLTQDFPNTWDGWVKIEGQTMSGLVYERGLEFEVLALCRKNHIYQCIPALLYKICVKYSQVRSILFVGDA